MDPQQWEILQKMLAAKQAAQMRDPSLRRNAAPGQGSVANTGSAIPALMGAQGGPDPNPYSQVPGGGSTANALPVSNPMVDDRKYYKDLEAEGFLTSMGGYGTALSSLFMPPNPATLALALGGLGLGTIGGLQQSHGRHNARKLGYQGN